MGFLVECAKSYNSLLNKEYVFTIGRRGSARTFRLIFEKRDFFHLAGLQYLKDRPNLKKDREIIFDAILSGEIDEVNIMASDFYRHIDARVQSLIFLQSFLEDNGTVFKYNEKGVPFSKINAEYLVDNVVRELRCFLFVDKRTENDCYCRSFFPMESTDYSVNQPKWTVLRKVRIDRETGEEILLYQSASYKEPIGSAL